MITKERAALVLKAVNPAVYDGDELTRDLASTIIALWDRVEKMKEGIAEIVGECGCSTARAILKETTHD